MRALVKQIITGVALTQGVPNSVTSSAVNGQRIRDHRGVAHFAFTANPGGATVGLMQMEGRLAPDQPYAPVHYIGSGARVEADAATFIAVGRSFGNTGIPILPDFRFVTTTLNPANAGVSLNAWIYE